MSIAATLFFVLCVAPALYMFVISFAGADGRLGFENYQRLLSEARQRELFVNSVGLGAGSAMMAVLIGAPLGLLFARASFPLKRLLRIALVAPLVIPPYILALAWIYIGGSAGIVAQLFGRDPLSEWTYSLAGAVVVLGVGFYPLAMLATEAAARRVDGRLEEAALLVAPRRRVLRRITLPLVAPSIVASALIAFVLAISEFGVPGLLRVNVFTTEVFTAFSALYDFGAATALAIPLLAAAVIAGTAAQFVIGEKLLVTRRGARSGLRLPSEHKTIVVLIALLTITVCVLLPLVALAREAGQLQRIAEAAASSRTAINNSLWLASRRGYDSHWAWRAAGIWAGAGEKQAGRPGRSGDDRHIRRAEHSRRSRLDRHVEQTGIWSLWLPGDGGDRISGAIRSGGRARSRGERAAGSGFV